MGVGLSPFPNYASGRGCMELSRAALRHADQHVEQKMHGSVSIFVMYC